MVVNVGQGSGWVWISKLWLRLGLDRKDRVKAGFGWEGQG